MATRHKEATPLLNYKQEMTTALSAPALPGGGCFRPFERARLVGLWQPYEVQKVRMTELAARLSEHDAKRAMLEILWAWPHDNAKYQVAPPLPLGPGLQDVLLREAERRGMLRITCHPTQDGSNDGVLYSYHPIERVVELSEHEKQGREQAVRDFCALMGGNGMPLLKSLTEDDFLACRLYMCSLVFSDWEMRLLPAEDRQLMRQPLPAGVLLRLEAERGRVQEEECTTISKADAGQAIPAEDNAPEAVEEGGDTTKREPSCRVFLARLYCANYRWLQNKVEKERGVQNAEG